MYVEKIDNSGLKVGDRVYLRVTSFYSQGEDVYEQGEITKITNSRIYVQIEGSKIILKFPYKKTKRLYYTNGLGQGYLLYTSKKELQTERDILEYRKKLIKSIESNVSDLSKLSTVELENIVKIMDK